MEQKRRTEWLHNRKATDQQYGHMVTNVYNRYSTERKVALEDAVHTMTRAFTLVIVFICIVLALWLAQYSKNTLWMCQANTPLDDFTESRHWPNTPEEDWTEVSAFRTIPWRIGQRSCLCLDHCPIILRIIPWMIGQRSRHLGQHSRGGLDRGRVEAKTSVQSSKG